MYYCDAREAYRVAAVASIHNEKKLVENYEFEPTSCYSL